MVRIPKEIGWPLAAAGVFGVFYYLANRAIFHPLKHPHGFWEVQPQLRAEDVWLRTADGLRLHAWWIPVEGAHLSTLYLHGNAGNISHRIAHIREINAAGSSLLIVDYRGYGRSDGKPSERGLYEDAAAGYRYLRAAGHRPERIVIHGESLGTAVAVDLASRVEAAGVILEAPFDSAGNVAGRILPVLGPLVIRVFDSREKIRRLRAPLLVIHGDRDPVIAIESGKALFAAAPEPKEFWVVPQAGHNDIVETAGAGYGKRLSQFYASLGHH